MEAGKPIWVESLLSDKDYAEMAKKYPNTYTNGGKKVIEFDCDFKWRKNMGGNCSEKEIALVNSRIDLMLTKAILNKNKVITVNDKT